MATKAANEMLQAMSNVWGKSYFPDAPENIDNADFQSGFEVGMRNEDKSIAAHDHAITLEWKRRGSNPKSDESFNAWKRGYWAGRYSAISETQEQHSTTKWAGT